MQPSRAHAQRRVIVVGRSVGRLVSWSVGLWVCLSARFLLNRGCCRYQTWICRYATGARHSKSLERRCPRTGRGPKIIYSGYYTRCALIRDRQPTAWDDFARPAEAEVMCIWKVSPHDQIIVERFIKSVL